MSSYLLKRPVSVYADHALSTERPKSKDGETVVYRLKDWPSGEEFMALMPSRYLRNTGTSHVDTLSIHLDTVLRIVNAVSWRPYILHVYVLIKDSSGLVVLACASSQCLGMMISWKTSQCRSIQTPRGTSTWHPICRPSLCGQTWARASAALTVLQLPLSLTRIFSFCFISGLLCFIPGSTVEI